MYCWAHAASTEEQRREARVRGGQNSAKSARLSKLMPAHMAPVFERLSLALEEVHIGALDPRQASAMAAIARAMVTVLQHGEVEERLRQLEAAASEESAYGT